MCVCIHACMHMSTYVRSYVYICMYSIYIYTYRILQSLLRQVHSPFQSEFPTEGDLVLTPSISRIFSFPSGHPVVFYLFFLVFPLFLFCHLSFLQQRVRTPDVTHPVNLPFIVCTMCLSYLTLCNTSSFLTRSVKLFFSILLLHRTLKFSRCF